MARIVQIDDVITHPNADSLEIAIVGGWQVIIRKDEFKVGDLAIFCEIDSWVPTELAPFLSKGKEPREYNGVKGEKLRTIRLRGELSQGLLLSRYVALWDTEVGSEIDQDVSEFLGIQKWEAPVNAQLAGQTKGNFPSAFPKTDQERIQNLSRQFENWKAQGLTFTVQEKLEGSSMTCYLLNGDFGVCSRNLDLKEDENNTFWKVAREMDIEKKMRLMFTKCDVSGETEDIAFQLELIGPGIQGNIYGLERPTARVFDIVAAKGMKYYTPEAVRATCAFMELDTAPFLGKVKIGSKLSSNYVQDIQDIIDMAEGTSELNPNQEREGIVFKCNEDPSITFKAISNKYLEKQKD